MEILNELQRFMAEMWVKLNITNRINKAQKQLCLVKSISKRSNQETNGYRSCKDSWLRWQKPITWMLHKAIIYSLDEKKKGVTRKVKIRPHLLEFSKSHQKHANLKCTGFNMERQQWLLRWKHLPTAKHGGGINMVLWILFTGRDWGASWMEPNTKGKTLLRKRYKIMVELHCPKVQWL